MRRKTRPLDPPAVSLFPFLAVLLCTMGSLIILLVFFVGQAQRAQTAEAAPDPIIEEPAAPVSDPFPSRDREERERAYRDALARKAEFEAALRELSARREEGARLLAAVREELSRDESQSGYLRGQVDELEVVETQLGKLAAGSARDRLVSQAEALRKRIEDQKTEVERARQAAASRPPSYAIIPYTGPNQTRRRPLYIECREDSIVLQPEGIVLDDDDFRGPMGPGNPLAATVRSMADHIRRHAQATGEATIPYPLLIVRPDGILTYYVAREALQVLGFDFGYELIEQDWKVEYQKPNPELTRHGQRALEVARQRQRELIAAAPRLYGSSARGRMLSGQMPGGSEGSGGDDLPGGNGSGRGKSGKGNGKGSDSNGLVVEGSGLPGSSVGGNRALGAYPGGTGGAAGDGKKARPDASATRRDAKGQLVQGDANVKGNGTGQGNGNGSGPALGEPGGSAAGESDLNGELYGLGPTGGPGGAGKSTNGKSPGGTSANEKDLAFRPQGGTPEPGTGYGSGSGEPNGAGGYPTGQGSDATAGLVVPGQASRDAQMAKEAEGNRPSSGRRPGEVSPRPSLRGGATAARGARGGSSTGQADGDSAGVGSPSGSSSGKAGGGSGGSGGPSNGPSSGMQSLASRRGENWAVPNVGHTVIGVQRPIILECHDDRLVVLPERKVIPLDTRTVDVIDQLVKVVHDHTNTWGTAGEGFYWRPELVCRVAPDGATRFAELRDLLDGSGLDVRQAQRR